MSRHYPLSPVERYCPSCDGYCRIGGELCHLCDGIGRTFISGGPEFGCKYKLSGCKPGQIVTLGNGDRGRIVRHSMRGTQTTEIHLIDPMLDEESAESTTYPSETGVASMSASSWFQDESGSARARHDDLDPLQGKNQLL